MAELFHIAQVNVARMVAPLDDPAMASFVALLDEINALADASPGFVWRLQSEAGNATYLRPYGDDRILFNMSVWETVEDLKTYVYRTAHGGVMRRRAEWFGRFGAPSVALWWVRAGRIPTVEEAKRRLERLQALGEGPYAFTLRRVFPPVEEPEAAAAASSCKPCGSA